MAECGSGQQWMEDRMRKRNMRGYVAGFALAAGLCITQGIPAPAATEVQSDSGTAQRWNNCICMWWNFWWVIFDYSDGY